MGERIKRFSHIVERALGFAGGDPLGGEDETVDSQKIEQKKTLFERLKLKTSRKKP